MLSKPSNSPASPEPGNAVVRNFPVDVILPILMGLSRAAALAPFIAMFLGEHFGLSDGRPAPWPWALAFISAWAYWLSRLINARLGTSLWGNILLLLGGFAAFAIWFALEPGWDVGPLLRAPWTMATDRGYFIVPFLLTLGVWVSTLRVSFDQVAEGPETVRSMMTTSMVGLAIGMVLAGLIGGDIGDAGLNAAKIALPTGMVAGIGAVGITEMAQTRRVATRRGCTTPGWNRWARLFVGMGVAVLLLNLITALIFGPGFLAVMMDVMRAIWGGIAQVLLYIMYGLVYVLFYIFRALAWLVNAIFGDVIGPIEMPEMQQASPEPQMQQPEQVRDADFGYAWLIRGILITAGVLIMAFIILRMTRRPPADEVEGDEERTSIFSASLARDQLRNLFRRRRGQDGPRKVNLNDRPGSVRDVMLYLQVLAQRQYVGRQSRETPHDFAVRLADDWPGLQSPLATIAQRYELVRYGERPEDLAAATGAWNNIYAARRDIRVEPPAPEPDPEASETDR